MMCFSVDPPFTSFQATYVNHFRTTCLRPGKPFLFFISAQIRADISLFAPFRAVRTHAKPPKPLISPVFSSFQIGIEIATYTKVLKFGQFRFVINHQETRRLG